MGGENECLEERKTQKKKVLAQKNLLKAQPKICKVHQKAVLLQARKMHLNQIQPKILVLQKLQPSLIVQVRLKVAVLLVHQKAILLQTNLAKVLNKFFTKKAKRLMPFCFFCL